MDVKLLAQLRSDLLQYPRMHGYYLLNLVPLPLGWQKDEEASLDRAFEALDDQPWEPPKMRPNEQVWSEYQVTEAKARSHLVKALVGGSQVGHSHETIGYDTAERLWSSFRSLFSKNARFYMGIGLGDPLYIFLQGIVMVDDEKAGCLCVIEDD